MSQTQPFNKGRHLCPCRLICPAVTPFLLPAAPPFSWLCLCKQNFRPRLLRMNFETVWVAFVHLRVWLSAIGENGKNFPLCSSMWELLSPSSWTLTFDQALIKSLVVVKRGSLVGTGEAPLSAHSQRFIYGLLHFWLWWLQYLSSYLNCIFKDFIQYLHAIQYELIFLCQFLCFLFNCLDFGMFLLLLFTNNLLGYWDVAYNFFCVCNVMMMTTAKRHKAGVGKPSLDELNAVITLWYK